MSEAMQAFINHSTGETLAREWMWRTWKIKNPPPWLIAAVLRVPYYPDLSR